MTDLPIPHLPADLPPAIEDYIRNWQRDPHHDLLPLPPYLVADLPDDYCADTERRIALWEGLWQAYIRARMARREMQVYTRHSWHVLNTTEVNLLVTKGWRFEHLASTQTLDGLRHTVIVRLTPDLTAQRDTALAQLTSEILHPTSPQAAGFEQLLRDIANPDK